MVVQSHTQIRAWGGVVCFVTNNGYIDSNTADGLRKTLANEFHDIYVYNLRGNSRTSGDLAKREGGNIFDIRVGVSIILLVKRVGPVDTCTLRYFETPDGLTKVQKNDELKISTLNSLNWRKLIPNAQGDWINQRDPNYEKYPIIGEKNIRETIFEIHSSGLKTNRDAWVYNSSEPLLRSNVERMIEFYNSEVERYKSIGGNVESFVDTDPKKFSWDRADRQRLQRGQKLEFDDECVRISAYRPFFKQFLAFDRLLNNTVYRLYELFPTPDQGNIGFHLVGPGTPTPFSALMTNALTEVAMLGAGSNGQYFSRYSYRKPTPDALFDEPEQLDNITDWALEKYQQEYGPQITKDEIFYYVYGMLHSPEYREKYASDLKKQLPRIPLVADLQLFNAFSKAGKELSDLHIGYEDEEPFPLNTTISEKAAIDPYECFYVQKMKYGGKPGAWDKTRIVYNQFIDIEGIPEEAQKYMLGSRSAVDWIIERYQVKTEKDSGIVNDPNDWSREHNEPRYIIDLLGRIVTVSLETMRIVDSLPPLGELK